MNRTPVISVLILAAMLNWSMTCCCGELMFVEIARGGCLVHQEDQEHHEHGHAGSDHSGNHQHSCHKDFGSSFVPVGMAQDQTPCVLVSTGIPMPSAGSQVPSAVLVRERAPRIPPPDIPLMTQSLLI